MSKQVRLVVVEDLVASVAAVAAGIIVWFVVDLILKNYGN